MVGQIILMGCHVRESSLIESGRPSKWIMSGSTHEKRRIFFESINGANEFILNN